jgi:aminoglycoside phosphotransferase family enzyme/predicted kinase
MAAGRERERLMSHGFPEHLQGLLHPGAYPHAVHAVEVVETHISWVLLTGEFAYKIKRPVHYPFVDLRSVGRREFLCREEVRLNRRFAPELYLEVCQITSLDGEARLNGSGLVIEHAIKMRQFRRDDELDRLLETARIEPGELAQFGRDLAHIHADLPVVEPTQTWGRPEAQRALILENLDECARAATVFGGEADVHALRAILHARLETATRWMSERFAGGMVRECHGDLHSRNIVRRGSRLLAFDCMEFEPAFRWIDVADEVAFLLADLDSCHQPLHAQAFLGGYLALSGDYQACRLLELYKAHRSLVRAKVSALSVVGVAEMGAAQIVAARQQYHDYLNCARSSLSPKRPILILMCGLSGSGKTWIAKRLAPLLGAVHLRSDIERKRLVGLCESARSGSDLEQGLYSREASTRVYQHLAQCAGDTLAGGYTTIVDATFNRREDRLHFHDLSVQLGVTVCVVHCQAPPEVLQARIGERHLSGDDPSEADLPVLQWQEMHCDPIQAEEPFVVFAAVTNQGDVVDTLTRQIGALMEAPSSRVKY